ncbi:hypothetical protein Bbelb_124660 [Branchiostoma belcheri]|nr:hypothetical protein Bbelb_124660 [Branchiostoma belcheri]
MACTEQGELGRQRTLASEFASSKTTQNVYHKNKAWMPWVENEARFREEKWKMRENCNKTAFLLKNSTERLRTCSTRPGRKIVSCGDGHMEGRSRRIVRAFPALAQSMLRVVVACESLGTEVSKCNCRNKT